jgi:hypothetical protein
MAYAAAGGRLYQRGVDNCYCDEIFQNLQAMGGGGALRMVGR